MDKNLWLAVGLSVAVYAAWFGFLEKRLAPPPPPNAAAPSAARPSKPSVSAPSPAAAQDASAAERLSQAREVPFGEARLRVHPRGAAVVSWRHRDGAGEVELVLAPAPGLFSAFEDLSFAPVPDAASPAWLARRPDGVEILKELLPGEGARLPRLRMTARNAGRAPAAVGPWSISFGAGLGTIESDSKENHKAQRALALRPGGGGLRGGIEKLAPGPHPGPYRWLGLDNRYFLVALLPPETLFDPALASPGPALTLTAKAQSLPPGGSFVWEIPFYAGPKGQARLKAFGAGLERAIDFGFFWQIGRPIMAALERLRAWTGNWGWAIVILTLSLQALLFPLTWKSLKAGASMKRLQPEIARLQKRHADDAARLNSEMMALYKRSGANPLGGCLPMLLQMPVFVALYNVLHNSWELHGAPWAFWIRDLSAKDPYYVLPLLMGGLMFLQTKLNPPAADPDQQKIMLLMPVVFTFMFLNFPSGLVLYWMTNSLASTILQVSLKSRLERAG